MGRVSGSRSRTWVLVSLAVALVLAYLVVVDLGISAGRIHHGVTVQGVDLGGLTEAEAAVRLRARARELKDEPVRLTGHGLDRSVLPTEVRWRPRPERTAAAAMEVGRGGGPLRALWDRVRAWLAGVEVDWAGKPGARAMEAYIVALDRDAAARGHDLDRATLRRRLRLSLATWPREPVAIPLGG